MISKETITHRIRKIIADSGMSPTEVAKQSNLKQSTMSNWYNGKTNINLIDYIKICQACNVPNGVFEQRETALEIPGEVSEQAEELLKCLIELHKIIGDEKESPFDVFLENALYMKKLLYSKLEKSEGNNLKVAEEGDLYNS